jgi:hypothetical protein
MKLKVMMKKRFPLVILSFLFLITPFISSAQEDFDWQGRWEVLVNEKTFCNIHIVMDLIDGQAKPTAILEGLVNDKPFRVTCDVTEIPQRNSIVLYEAAAVNGTKQYEKTEPLAVLTMNIIENEYTVSSVWMQLDLTKGAKNKNCAVRKIPNPRYRGLYTFTQDGIKTALTINKIKRTGFQAKVETETSSVDCNCELQARHLAVCYPNDEKGAFYLDFNEDGVKLVDNYDENIYNSEYIRGENRTYLVLNTTLKK